MMQEMFLSSARPFYRSADLLELEAIPKEIYVQFVTGHFRGAEKKISEENVAKVYDFFKGLRSTCRKRSMRFSRILP